VKFSKGSNSKLGDADGRKGVKLLLSVALGCTLLCTSCQTPAPQGDVRPVWADRAPGPSEGKSFFVGHSRILDSADEKLGINQATDDALAQIAKATGSELSAGGALAGVRQEATFCEVSSHGGHVKYHVLVSVPEAEMTRLETKLRMGLDSQLAEAQAAIRDGSLTRARDILSSTVSSHPESAAAWTALAETQEKLRDWEGASKAWDSLRRSSNEPSVQDLAAAGLRRANDERAIVRLSQAENAAQAGQSSHALDLLVEAAALKPSPLVLTRLSNRYF